ncbi:hypothetical protein DFH28DRAFT_1132208 [Melampsora americana]|nr:hypothetical protein DFH28DRAFT_1132208 [Melampsora americana]
MTIYLNPINTHQRLPLPVPRQTTGQYCRSEHCKHPRPHSTVYYKPKRQCRFPTIGICCPYDKTYYRQYNIEEYKLEIRQHNSLLETMTDARQISASDFDPLLQNSNIEPPPPSQPGARRRAPKSKTRPEDQCTGSNGQMAEGHSIRKNAGCAIDMCAKCCEKFLPQSIFCSKHDNIARTKLKKQLCRASQAATVASSTPSTSNDQQLPLTQSGRSFYRELSSPEFNKFRNITIKKQAEEREQQERFKQAKNNVSMFVWASTENGTSPCSFWRVPAPQWPLFAFQESEVFITLVKSQLGADWNGTFQVWNIEEQLWMNIQMSTVELYQEDVRKILIIFPGIEPYQCTDLNRHKGTFGRKDNSGMMDISQYLTHTTPTSSPPFPVPVAPPSVIYLSSGSSNSSPDLPSADVPPFSSTQISPIAPIAPIAPVTTAGRGVTPTPAAGTPTPPLGPPGTNGPWPDNVTMRQMLTFLDSTRQLRIKQGWDLVFGSTHIYTTSTVSHYRRWLLNIDYSVLTNYVEHHGDQSVQAGKEFFHVAWRQCDPRKTHNSRLPALRPRRT